MQLYSCMQQTIARREKSWQIGLVMSHAILVKLKTEQEKIQLLKKASALKGSKLYLAEDLTIDERKERWKK